MAGTMRTFDSARRDLLRLSSMGLAASTVSAIPAFAASKKPAAPSLAPMLFDVRTFGATGDSKTVDSPAINKAIEAAAAVGGGTVFFPAGNYVSFSIRLKSHVDLYLSQGCAIIAAESPLPGQTTGYMGGVYDAAEPDSAWEKYQDWGHNHWHNSLLWGDGISDFSITGPGLIWGKGLSFGADRAVRGDYPKYTAEQAGVGNKAIGLKNCHNVVLRDFSILKGGHFWILFTGVDNLTIDNLKIDTDRDGMDIDCCRNVRVTNCYINAPPCWIASTSIATRPPMSAPRRSLGPRDKSSFITWASGLERRPCFNVWLAMSSSRGGRCDPPRTRFVRAPARNPDCGRMGFRAICRSFWCESPTLRISTSFTRFCKLTSTGE